MLQPTVTGPAKAIIRITNHEESRDKKVLYSDLFPVGIAYPELMIDIQNIVIAADTFCFFSEKQSPKTTQTTNIFAGLIVHVDDKAQTCKIHRYQQSNRPKNKFTPLWTQHDGQVYARAKQQKHQIPALTSGVASEAQCPNYC